MDLDCILYKQDGKNYLHINDTEVYFKNLEHTYQYINNDIKAEFLNFAFVTLCASTLEASLNHIIFSFYIDEFGPIDYKKYTDSLINMSFSNKLYSTPNVVTKSDYYFDSNCFTIKTLEELITLRNKILHKKPTLQATEYDMHNLELGKEIIFKNNNLIQTITKKQCVNFYKAMINFKLEFMIPFFERRLKESKLLRKKL